MTYIFALDTLVGSYFVNVDLFFIMQIILGFVVLYQSVWQRVHQHSFKNSSLQYGMDSISLKSGQLGLYIHMMISIVSIIDGFQNIAQHTLFPHLFVLSVLFGTCLSKFNVITSIKKKIDKAENLFI